jgi:hypothetical protein
MRNKSWLLGAAVLAILFNQTSVWSRPPAKTHSAPVSHAASNQGMAANTAYINRLRSKLMNEWHVLMQDGKNHVVITALVNADGSVQDNPQIVSTPKNQAAEQAGNEAFAKCQPLEALPAGQTQARVILTFDSSSDPHGDSSSNIYTRIEPIAQPKPAPGGSEPAK